MLAFYVVLILTVLTSRPFGKRRHSGIFLTILPDISSDFISEIL